MYLEDVPFEAVPMEEFMYLQRTQLWWNLSALRKYLLRMYLWWSLRTLYLPTGQVSYHKQLGSFLLLCLCNAFGVLTPLFVES